MCENKQCCMDEIEREFDWIALADHFVSRCDECSAIAEKAGADGDNERREKYNGLAASYGLVQTFCRLEGELPIATIRAQQQGEG